MIADPHQRPERASRSEVEWISTHDRFADIAEAWDELAAAGETPFVRHGWLNGWLQAFGGIPATPILWRDGSLTAAIPLVRGRGGLVGMANAHSPSLAPLSRTDSDLGLLARELFGGRHGSLELPSLSAADRSTDALIETARSAGRLVVQEPGQVSPIVETDGDHDEWLATSKKRWRGPLQRYRRKMGRDFKADFRLLEAPGGLDDMYREGLRLERSGWKGKAGTAILCEPETERFYEAIARDAAHRGELSLSAIYLDGKMVAFDLSILSQGRLYLLKTAYDESMRRLSPGLVLRLSVIERCFELGLTAHELLGDADPYKLQFATAERRHIALRCYRRTPFPVARYGYRVAVRPRMRTIYRRLRSRD